MENLGNFQWKIEENSDQKLRKISTKFSHSLKPFLLNSQDFPISTQTSVKITKKKDCKNLYLLSHKILFLVSLERIWACNVFGKCTKIFFCVIAGNKVGKKLPWIGDKWAKIANKGKQKKGLNEKIRKFIGCENWDSENEENFAGFSVLEFLKKFLVFPDIFSPFDSKSWQIFFSFSQIFINFSFRFSKIFLLIFPQNFQFSLVFHKFYFPKTNQPFHPILNTQ